MHTGRMTRAHEDRDQSDASWAKNTKDSIPQTSRSQERDMEQILPHESEGTSLAAALILDVRPPEL